MSLEGTSKYFKPEESSETLHGKFDSNAPHRKYQHCYKSGAVYQGEWKGGMRHGLGKIMWPDGASYEGEWQYN
jgi:hypothetical protein